MTKSQICSAQYSDFNPSVIKKKNSKKYKNREYNNNIKKAI